MPNNRFREMSKTHDGVTTYAIATDALGGESNDVMKPAGFYNLKNYDAILGQAIASNVVSTHVITLTMWEATDTDGGGSQTITGRTAVYTSTQATDAVAFTIEVDADMLTDGYDFVGMQASTDDADGSETVALSVIPTFGAHRQASPPA